MSILDDLDLTKKDLEEGESTAIAKVFEAMPSQTVNGVVDDIVVYKNQWDGFQMRYTVIVKDDKGEDRKVTFRSDIGKTLKDGKPNHGYAGRLKQFCHATNTAIEDLSTGEKVKIKSFGKELEGDLIVGMKGKKLKVLLRLTEDTSKDEGQAFKFTNDIQAVVALDGTQEDGEDAVTPFKAAIEKAPVFKVEKKSKAKSKESSAVKTASGESVNDML